MRLLVVVIVCVVVVAAERSKIRGRNLRRRAADEPFTLSFGPAPGSSGGCTGNKLNNCEAYGSDICSNSDYTAWVAENCCAFCNGGGSSTGGNPDPGFSLSFGTQAPMTGGGACTDALPNCASYTTSVCTDSNYAQWVDSNCKKFCNKCSGSTGGSYPIPQPGTGTCTDKLPNCSAYGQSVCTSSDYAQWAKDNCAKYCNLCGGSTMGTQTGTQTMTGGCADVTSNCAMLNRVSHICTDSGSRVFAQQQCAMTCGMCSGSSTGGGMPSPNTGGSGGSFTGSSSGCVYNNKLYQQGQTWKDGCKYSCTCVDGTSGKYECSALCVTWNLPSQCSMNPPAPGKCCQTPNCPSGFTLQYPPGYVEN